MEKKEDVTNKIIKNHREAIRNLNKENFDLRLKLKKESQYPVKMNFSIFITLVTLSLLKLFDVIRHLF